MAFLQINFLSQALMRTVNVNVILPTDKLPMPGAPEQPDRLFPTLYLLHGVLGSQVDWINGTKLQRWAEEKDLAVVMPAGENSFYVDHDRSDQHYGDFIGRELVEQTRKMLPLSRKREDTFLGGLSMGGYGALRNGLKYHETFSRVLALSTANVVDGIADATEETPLFFQRRGFLERIFGDLSAVQGGDKDILWLAGRLREKGMTLPAVYMACGLEDVLLPGNRKLRDCLKGNGFDLVYEEGPGNHEWDFWNEHLKRGLDWLPLNGTAGMNSGNVFA